jgi:hypothetical protein
VSFTVPSLTTEGLTLKLGQIELRAGSSQGQPFDWDAWMAQAQQLDTAGLKPGPAQVETRPASGPARSFSACVFSAGRPYSVGRIS